MRKQGTAELSKSEFPLFQGLLEEESGLHFDPDRQQLLWEGLGERMAKREIGSAREYFHLLKFHPEGKLEVRALIDLLTIGETYFFRNRPQFDALQTHVLLTLVSDRLLGSKTIRIWSAGCATGEEPYSIAITLLETLPSAESWQIHILATDINRKFLKRAEEGIYGARAVKEIPAQWFSKHFVERGGKFFLKESVKKLVTFSSHNLAKDPFTLAPMRDLDILFCRNVTIYFSLKTTRRIIDQFADCMSAAAHLFLGHAESLWGISDRFVPIESSRTILYRKRSLKEAAEIPKPFVDLPEPATFLVEASTELPTSEIQKDPKHRAVQLAEASVLADQGRYEEAIPVIQQAAASDNLCAEAHYLLGVLCQKTQRLDRAIEAFERALYVDPTLALAWVSLGNIHRYQRRPAKAKREFRNALKALEARPEEELVRFSGDITGGYLKSAVRRTLEQMGRGVSRGTPNA